MVLPPAYTFRSRNSIPVDKDLTQAAELANRTEKNRKNHLSDFIPNEDHEIDHPKPKTSRVPTKQAVIDELASSEPTNSLPQLLVRSKISRASTQSDAIDQAVKDQSDRAAPQAALTSPQVPIRVSSREPLSSPTTLRRTQTAGDIQGLRRLSTTSKEGQNIMAASSAVTSRLHKHWLRPCAACARKLKAKEPRNETESRLELDINGPVKREKQATDMYHRSIAWIKHQEVKLAGLQK